MPHPSEQGGPDDQGWSGPGDGTVALTEGDPAKTAGEPAPRRQDPYQPPPFEGAARGAAHEQDPRPVREPAGWAPPPWPWPPPTNTKAIIALCTAFPVPVVGIVFGIMARREIARTGEAGRAYATWGLVVGIALCTLIAAYVVFTILYSVLLVVLFAHLADVATAGAGPGLGA